MKNGMKSQVSNKNEAVNKNKACERLEWSRKLLIALLGLTILCVAVPILDAYFRPLPVTTSQVIQNLNLSNLSIIAGGRPLRHPEAAIPSVNLNFSPHFSLLIINPEFLLLSPSQNFNRHFDP